MTEKIAQLIKDKWNVFPVSKTHKMPEERILLSKFFHGKAWLGSKVLFLATCSGEPICIIKTARDVSANPKIKKEKELQEKFVGSKNLSAPRTYFDEEINGRYLYAEEVLYGKPLSESLAFKKEDELIKIIGSRGFSGGVLTSDIAKVFEDNFPFEDGEAKELIKRLVSRDFPLKKGFSHGDFTRKNIIYDGKNLRLIDWERAGERPFWLIDAVHFMVSLRNIKDIREWENQAAGAFAKSAGINADTASALYSVETLFEIFCKKYPERYLKVTERISLL